VRLVCTTDDPTDSLEHHAAVRASGFEIKVLPTWRPDKAWAIHRTEFWNAWQDQLAATSGMEVRTYDEMLEALRKRHDFFASLGCKLSDYGPETVGVETASEETLRAMYVRVRGGGSVDATEASQFRQAVMFESMKMDAAADWTMQIHYGAMRNNNARMFAQIGPDTGFDSMGDWLVAQGLSRLLDRLDRCDALPRTILYSLNPRDNELLGSMIGNFQRGPVAGKMQLGSGWWFNDQFDGMTRQLEALSQLGLLSRFVGMLTDSRSFISYTRHEYFRRILCNILGRDITSGRLPDDVAWVGEVVKDIAYRNAARYFGFGL
jgi:glucuronate isomerase